MARRGELIPTPTALAERKAQYAELRDGGMRPVDAGREIGLGVSTRDRYEQWYREARELPRRERGYGW